MNLWYGLDGKPISDQEAGRLLADTHARRVADTKIVTGGGAIRVSTVFLVSDHGFGMSQKPILWETMIFEGPLDQEMARYTSREDAERGHMEVVNVVRLALDAEGVDVLAVETFTPTPAAPLELPPALDKPSTCD